MVAGAAQSMPGRVPQGLVMLAVWWLPPSWRQRYCEEFCSELVQLPPGERFRYARRVLACAWRLRRALAGTVCAPDGAPARRVEG